MEEFMDSKKAINMNEIRFFQLVEKKLDKPFSNLYVRKDIMPIPKHAKTISIIEETNLNSSLVFSIKLLPKPIFVDLRCLQGRLLEQSGIKNNKAADIFELLTLQEEHQISIEGSSCLETNLSFLLFRLRVGSSDRLYLFYTLSNQVYTSYTKKDFNFIKKRYYESYSLNKDGAIFRLSNVVENYTYKEFMVDKNNVEYINSITVLPDFQKRLSEITGVKKLAYIHPKSLYFQQYLTDSLQAMFGRVKEESFKEYFIQGDRIDYKAHTHAGVKPLLLGNSILSYINELEEIYWLNTNNYQSSGEKLIINEDKSNIKFFTQDGYWKPSLEDLMKVGFADFLVFKTYRPSSIIPTNLHDYTLAFFSTLYLIDFIGRGAINIEPEETTAYSVLLYICNRNNHKAFKDKLSTSVQPSDIELHLHHSEYLYFKNRQDKVGLFRIEYEYSYYKIRPIEFIPFIEQAYNELDLNDRIDKRAMFHLVFQNALKNFINTYREKNNYIGESEADTLLENLCTLHGVDPDAIRGMYGIPKKMYLQEFSNLIALVKLYANSQDQIH